MLRHVLKRPCCAVWGLASAASLPLGALLALYRVPPEKMRALMMAFGGGALLFAVSRSLPSSCLPFFLSLHPLLPPPSDSFSLRVSPLITFESSLSPSVSHPLTLYSLRQPSLCLLVLGAVPATSDVENRSLIAKFAKSSRFVVLKSLSNCVSGSAAFCGTFWAFNHRRQRTLRERGEGFLSCFLWNS